MDCKKQKLYTLVIVFSFKLNKKYNIWILEVLVIAGLDFVFVSSLDFCTPRIYDIYIYKYMNKNRIIFVRKEEEKLIFD